MAQHDISASASLCDGSAFISTVRLLSENRHHRIQND